MRRDRRSRLVAGIALYCSLVLVGVQPGQATSVIKLADEGLVTLATVILEGTVTQTQVQWNANRTQIHTVVTISVRTVLKGTLPDENAVTLRLLGGRVGDDVMEVVGGPVITQGEEVILFLRKDIPDLFPIVGLYQGKFSVLTDEDTGIKTVKGRGVPVDDFVANIQQIIEDQAQ